MEYAFWGMLVFVVVREVLAYWERRDWAAERRLLMLRVQAPELAVQLDTREFQEEPEQVQSLPYDDDEAFWRMRKAQGS